MCWYIVECRVESGWRWGLCGLALVESGLALVESVVLSVWHGLERCVVMNA